ncbi:MAG TPA: hypothetical protein DD719_06860 [Desulfotomaculum sp.]|nr:hypothetical protein [Desulfotomaculum sp.]
MKLIEIHMTKCKLFLYEQELVTLLARDPNLWAIAIRRGKGIKRARSSQGRNIKIQKERNKY